MAQDGHRCGHVVAFASVKNETAVYMRRIFDTLKLTNPEACSNIGVVITDRDFTEQQTVAAALPHASLQVCIFHVLRAFNRERCFIFNSVAHTPQSAGMVGPSTVFRRRPYREKRRWHRSVESCVQRQLQRRLVACGTLTRLKCVCKQIDRQNNLNFLAHQLAVGLSAWRLGDIDHDQSRLDAIFCADTNVGC